MSAAPRWIFDLSCLFRADWIPGYTDTCTNLVGKRNSTQQSLGKKGMYALKLT